MLLRSLKPLRFDNEAWDKETWDQYRERMKLSADEAVLQFYRQVVYDHFDHFNNHYPDFNLDDYDIVIKEYTAQEANDLIRFFRGKVMDDWGGQFDEFARKNQDYIIFKSMSSKRTFPFPPILIDPKLLTGQGWRECGRPLHLIEGTHRVSYLRRMLQLGLVTPESRHQFVLLKPKVVRPVPVGQ